jgi:C_GCAxxG_C_C family probable redox protein
LFKKSTLQKYTEKRVPLQKNTNFMETRKHIAAEKLENGTHNCAQAVICTYADLVGINEETGRNLGNAFGSGMGNMECTCGALVGAGIVLGLAKKDRVGARKAMRQIMTQFQQRNGATQCKMLKGVGTGVVLRQCTDCVADASEFLEEQL